MASCKQIIALLVVSLFASGVAPALGVNLLTNGSFESWTGGYTPTTQPDRIFNDLTLNVSGWIFAIGLSSDLYRDMNASGAQSSYYSASHGDYLAGSGSFQTTHEGISQSFAVAPNTTYQLTFEMAPGGLNYSGSWIENATVGSSWLVELSGALTSGVSNTFNSNLAHFDSSATTNPLAWTPQSQLFTSDSAGGSVLLKFTAFGDLTHVFLDNVVVEAVGVPEPASFMILLIGLGGILALRRRGDSRIAISLLIHESSIQSS